MRMASRRSHAPTYSKVLLIPLRNRFLSVRSEINTVFLRCFVIFL